VFLQEGYEKEEEKGRKSLRWRLPRKKGVSVTKGKVRLDLYQKGKLEKPPLEKEKLLPQWEGILNTLTPREGK